MHMQLRKSVCINVKTLTAPQMALGVKFSSHEISFNNVCRNRRRVNFKIAKFIMKMYS